MDALRVVCVSLRTLLMRPMRDLPFFDQGVGPVDRPCAFRDHARSLLPNPKRLAASSSALIQSGFKPFLELLVAIGDMPFEDGIALIARFDKAVSRRGEAFSDI